MHKILLLSISVLLCCTQVQALICRTCKVTTGCREGIKESCEALPGQHCTTINFFRDNKVVAYLKGCSLPGDKCNHKRLKEGSGMERICCNDKDFCNE